MKNIFFLLLVSFFTLTSCISDEESSRQVNSVFQGNWFGTFSGDESGTVVFVVEKEGTIVGELDITSNNIKKEIKGYVNFSGKFDMNTDNGFKFSGYLAGNKSNGTWTTNNQQGQFTFQKK